LSEIHAKFRGELFAEFYVALLLLRPDLSWIEQWGKNTRRCAVGLR
jgi:hypothetical protein